MAAESSGRKTYMMLGFLDFLAYYVPGIMTIIAVAIVLRSTGGELAPEKLLPYHGVNDYINNVVWTVLSLVIPYVIGHLVFPLGYVITRYSRFKATPLGRGQLEHCRQQPGDKETAPSYCAIEGRDFPKCLYLCFATPAVEFNDLMITRFRTLSRFCRAMLAPILFLAGGLLFLASRVESYWLGATMTAVALAGSFFGIGWRYKRYEQRWRNAICIAAVLAPRIREQDAVSQRGWDKNEKQPVEEPSRRSLRFFGYFSER